MSIDIKKLDRHHLRQFKELLLVFEDVFEMKDYKMPGDNYLQQLLERENFFVFVALEKDRVVGGLTAYMWQQYYSESPLVYVYDLAVRTEYQRQGIGKMLMSGITEYSKTIGAEEVFVQADEEDDYAVAFYRATGAAAEKVIHFYYRLNAAAEGDEGNFG